MEDVDFDALGAQYRDAKTAIGTHRARQAKAEVAYAAAVRHAKGDTTVLDVAQAKATVDKTVADVEWCKAVTVACGEAYKGESFDDVITRNAGSGRPSAVQMLAEMANEAD